MASEVLKRARYKSGNALRWLTRPWRQWEISPDDATSLFGCGFGASGWHHLRQTFQQIEARPGLDLRQTVSWRFLQEFCPNSVFELAGARSVPGAGPFTFPWSGFKRGEVLTKDPWSSRFCGPSTDEFARAELQRSLKLLQALRAHGYRPTQYPNTFVGGVWLIAEDGSKRFLVLQGNHRMAALAHLGVRRIAVRALRGHHVCIRASEASAWPMVKSGACALDDAKQVFSMYFRENGWHIAGLLNLGQKAANSPDGGAQ